MIVSFRCRHLGECYRGEGRRKQQMQDCPILFPPELLLHLCYSAGICARCHLKEGFHTIFEIHLIDNLYVPFSPKNIWHFKSFKEIIS